MWLLETGCRHAVLRVDDVVGLVGCNATREHIIAGQQAHAEGNRVIGAGTVATDAERTDHLPVGIKRHATAKGDDAAGGIADRWLAEAEIGRLERVGIVEPVERSAGLRGAVEIGGGECQAIIAEIIGRSRLGDGDGTAARSHIERRREIRRADHRTQNALPIDDRRPHPVRLENAAIGIGEVDHNFQLALHGARDAGRNSAAGIGMRAGVAYHQQGTRKKS